jgi:hypothetical protein
MAVWATFYADLLPHLPGLSEPAADQELRRAAQEFCRRTKVWKQWLAPITLTGAATYAVVLPTDSMVYRFDTATVDGTPVSLPSWNELEADPAAFTGRATGFTTRDRVSVIPTSTYSSGALALRAVLAPSDQAATFPDDLAAQYRDGIVAGARARLMVMPGRPYTSLDLAAIAAGQFETAIGRAQHEAHKGFSNSVPRMRIRDC